MNRLKKILMIFKKAMLKIKRQKNTKPRPPFKKWKTSLAQEMTSIMTFSCTKNLKKTALMTLSRQVTQ